MNREQLPDGVPEEELIAIYVSSAEANLSSMACALGLGSPPGSAPDWATLQRVSHSLKGSSSQFGFYESAQVAATLEHCAAQLQKAPAGLTPELRGLLAEAIEDLANLVREISQGRPNHDPSRLCQRLRGVIS